MSGIQRVDLGTPALLAFRGPDAERFLNGQLTQDVRKVAGGKVSLPSCVTDAKGKLQFRVTLLEGPGGELWVSGEPGTAEELEARITRYLIADDVETEDLTGRWDLWHFTGSMPAPDGVVARESTRFGVQGADWWVSAGTSPPAGVPLLDGEMLEIQRISRGIPVWGREITAGMLPPEAGLDATDISYHKGCYIGQEVISRIKSAGKVNRSLGTFFIETEGGVEAPEPGELVDSTGKPSGELTSISPVAESGGHRALGFAKRGATEFFLSSAGKMLLVRCG